MRVPDVGFAVHVVHGMERDRSSDEGLVLRRRGTGRGDASFPDVVGLAEVSSSIMLEEESVGLQILPSKFRLLSTIRYVAQNFLSRQRRQRASGISVYSAL